MVYALNNENGSTKPESNKDNIKANEPATNAIPIPMKNKTILAVIKKINPSMSNEKIMPGKRTKPQLVISQKKGMNKIIFHDISEEKSKQDIGNA